MFSQALDRITALGASALAVLPGLLLGLAVFGLGLLIARGVRAGVRRAVAMREASADVSAVLGRIAGGVATLVAFLVGAAVAFPSVSASERTRSNPYRSSSTRSASTQYWSVPLRICARRASCFPAATMHHKVPG